MQIKSGTDTRRGQSLVEVALMLPLLILLLLGMVEVVNIGRTYLALLDTTYQGAHLGSQGVMQYDNSEINTLVTQDLTRKKYNTSGLIDVIIIRANLTGGTGLQNYIVSHMRSPGRDTVLTTTRLVSRLKAGDPDGRLIAVEIVFDYNLLFPWPNFGGIFPDPFPIRAYTIQYVAR